MTIKSKGLGFIAAGLANFVGVLFFSKLFTNEGLNNAFSSVFSNFGLLMILVWGLAYISVYKIFYKVSALVGVFVIEKLIYFATWIYWHMKNDVIAFINNDFFTGVFMVIYGVNDVLFMAFFMWIFTTNKKHHTSI